MCKLDMEHYLSSFGGGLGSGLAYVILKKSDDLVSFNVLLFSRLVVRFSKCEKRFLLKNLKIVDTYNTI